jgi:hypothetical protein
MKGFGFILAVVLSTAAVIAVPADATTPQAQTLELTGHLTGPSTVAGTWTAAGFVDDAGSYTERFRFAGQTVHVEKVLVGSKGTFLLRAQAVAVWLDQCRVTFTAGSWQVVGGTGAYERLKAGGTPAATEDSFGDVCTGAVELTHVGQAHDD